MSDTPHHARAPARVQSAHERRLRELRAVQLHRQRRPRLAIAAVTADGGDRLIHPLFVSVSPDMHLADHDGQAPR